ncbi:MAG: CBS domain-containing protein [Acidimicrobiales bacterium]
MLVSTVLQSKGSEVATIDGSARVADAVADMTRHRIGALVVSGDGIHIDGIVSERDVVQRLSPVRMDLLDEPVRSIMSKDVEVCRPDDDVEMILRVMTERRIRHLPVVEDGRLCGIVSIGDAVKSRIEQLEKDRNELMEYISAR